MAYQHERSIWVSSTATRVNIILNQYITCILALHWHCFYVFKNLSHSMSAHLNHSKWDSVSFIMYKVITENEDGQPINDVCTRSYCELLFDCRTLRYWWWPRLWFHKCYIDCYFESVLYGWIIDSIYGINLQFKFIFLMVLCGGLKLKYILY